MVFLQLTSERTNNSTISICNPYALLQRIQCSSYSKTLLFAHLPTPPSSQNNTPPAPPCFRRPPLYHSLSHQLSPQNLAFHSRHSYVQISLTYFLLRSNREFRDIFGEYIDSWEMPSYHEALPKFMPMTLTLYSRNFDANVFYSPRHRFLYFHGPLPGWCSPPSQRNRRRQQHPIKTTTIPTIPQHASSTPTRRQSTDISP